MSDTIVDVKVDFDVMLLGQLFELLRARNITAATELSTIVTLLYAAALQSEQGPKLDDSDFVKLAQEALEQARNASKSSAPPA